jgi:hypothetical protein
MDPKEIGEAEKWYKDAADFDMQMKVPAAWNAQGAGTETERLFHDFPGPAWYRRTAAVPESWKGKIIWLKFGGVHRYADVWVNGESVGSHIGYLTPFKFDISRYCHTGANSIVVRVDGRQRRDVDPLIGCFDVIDAVNITWGGMYRDVELEATGQNWIEDVFVVPHLDSNVAEVRVEVGSIFSAREALLVKAEVYDQRGRRAGRRESALAADSSSVSIPVSIGEPMLWSPKTPYLYTAKVRLTEGPREIDRLSTRFGMREIKVSGGRILLNGKPVFLRGYGDDCIFPNTIAPPAEQQEYYRRFKIARAYGFNYVRHHSWWPLQEYFDVADELGIMLQPEFPIAYQGFYDAASPERRKLYLEQWTGIIKASRNHPSIVTWCMGNELNPQELDLAPEFYRIAKETDPTRLVILTDGIGMPGPEDRSGGLLDFVTAQFNDGGSIGFNDRKYDLGDLEPRKPIVAHEMANFATLPDPAQADLFKGGIRPFWLYTYRDAAAKKGISALLPKWVDNSNKLQAVCLKTNFEAARRARWLSGYDQWLLQDYWTGSNGALDMFYRPKGLTAAEFRKFNSPTVLLMDCPRRNFWSGETAKISLLASRFEDEPSEDAQIRWELRDGRKVLVSGSKRNLQVRSDGLQRLADVSVGMPKLTTARKLTLAAQLTDRNGKTTNDWNLWVFPADRLGPGESRVAVGSPVQLATLYPWAEKVPKEGQLPRCDLLISSNLVPGSVDYLQNGGRVLLLASDEAFPVLSTAYKPYWWLVGGPSDSTGTQILRDHPAMKDVPNDGWCDLEFYNLINRSDSVVLDGLPVKADPIIRCLDTHVGLANRAFLVEFRVGRGRLLVSSLNFGAALAEGDPAGAFLLDRLIRYALGPEFQPAAVLPADYLALAEGRTPTPPTAPRVNGFERMISSMEPALAYHSYSRCWLIRQSDGTQRLEWETAPVKLGASDQISLVWTGAMGFISQPRGSFKIELNGRPLLDFDVTRSSRVWSSADGRAELFFDVKESPGQDAFGVMCLTVPTEMLTDGKPATISVVGAKSASARWFMVADNPDTLGHEGS